jgi:hypothetical protein
MSHVSPTTPLLRFYYYNAAFESVAHQHFDPLDDDSPPVLPERFTFALPAAVELIRRSYLLFRNFDGNLYLGKVYDKRRLTTFENVYTIRQALRLFVTPETLLAPFFGNKLDSVLKSTVPMKLPERFGPQMRDALITAAPSRLQDDYFKFDWLVGGQYSDLVPQAIDSFSVAFSLFGLDPRDIPPLTEEQILDFDVERMFSNQINRLPDGRHFFQHQGKVLYLHKVHNTRIERCIGVDLIYNFLEERRLVFVQYKCLNDETGKKFYKSNDKHFPTELAKMKEIPGVNICPNFMTRERSELRICRCPVYVKLCRREIQGKRMAPYGFYYSICAWDHIYTEDAASVTLDDQPHITNEQFLELTKSGLFGSTPNQSDEISKHLVDQAQDERLKLVFTEVRAG